MLGRRRTTSRVDAFRRPGRLSLPGERLRSHRRTRLPIARSAPPRRGYFMLRAGAGLVPTRRSARGCPLPRRPRRGDPGRRRPLHGPDQGRGTPAPPIGAGSPEEDANEPGLRPTGLERRDHLTPRWLSRSQMLLVALRSSEPRLSTPGGRPAAGEQLAPCRASTYPDRRWLDSVRVVVPRPCHGPGGFVRAQRRGSVGSRDHLRSDSRIGSGASQASRIALVSEWPVTGA